MKENNTKTILILSLLAIVGMVVWVAISLSTNKKEAWDTEIFWSIGFPLMLLFNAIAGFIDPKKVMMKGLISVSLQPIAMMVDAGEIGSMFPLGIIVFGFMGMLFSLGGVVGSFLKIKFFSQQN